MFSKENYKSNVNLGTKEVYLNRNLIVLIEKLISFGKVLVILPYFRSPGYVYILIIPQICHKLRSQINTSRFYRNLICLIYLLNFSFTK